MSIDVAADAAHPLPTAASQDARSLPGERFAFTGSAREYFGIWIVNLLLTIVTIGIYSAWAKVRSRKYFYRHTSFAGDRFDYHARPLGILVGRLIGAALGGAYLLVAWLAPGWEWIPFLLIFLAAPWLLLKGARFNARNSSYRNVRFGFDGSLRESYAAFVGWPLLGMVSLGTLMPFALQRQARWGLANHRFGDAQVEFSTPVRPYYGLFFKSGGLLLLGFVLLFAGIFGVMTVSAVVFGAESLGGADGSEPASPVVLTVGVFAYLAMLLLYALVGAFFVTRSLQLGLGGSRLAGHGFNVALKAREVGMLYLTNLLAIVFTLGLAIPWAKIRTARYQLERISLEVDEAGIQQIVAQRAADASAVGQEVGEAFEVEFDFGI